MIQHKTPPAPDVEVQASSSDPVEKPTPVGQWPTPVSKWGVILTGGLWLLWVSFLLWMMVLRRQEAPQTSDRPPIHSEFCA